MSGIRPPDCSKFAKNLESDNDATIFWHDVIANFLTLFLLSSSVTGRRFKSISSLVLKLWGFFYKRFTRNPDIRNTPVWVLPNISRLGQAMDTNIATNVSNRVLLNSEKFQSYSFYRFWVIKGKPTEGRGGG